MLKFFKLHKLGDFDFFLHNSRFYFSRIHAFMYYASIWCPIEQRKLFLIGTSFSPSFSLSFISFVCFVRVTNAYIEQFRHIGSAVAKLLILYHLEVIHQVFGKCAQFLLFHYVIENGFQKEMLKNIKYQLGLFPMPQIHIFTGFYHY